MTPKVLTVVGARPQFVKAAAVSRAVAATGLVDEVLLHTGQHYDENMSEVFFRQLGIPQPRYRFELGGGQHGAMTGRMLAAIEDTIEKEKPDWVLVYGDTNSTMAGALASTKLHVPVAHVESGLRSFNRRMPEEINRVVTDRVSDLLFCPSDVALRNLEAEGIRNGVYVVGDVMVDVALMCARLASSGEALERLRVRPREFALATLHRAENTDEPARLREIVEGLAAIGDELPLVLPLHPRTRKALESCALARLLERVRVVDPLPFLDMMQLERSAAVILTDSGGVQKEAYFFGVPCITLRDETEWTETVDLGWNVLVGANRQRISAAFRGVRIPDRRPPVYGDGTASPRIVECIARS